MYPLGYFKGYDVGGADSTVARKLTRSCSPNALLATLAAYSRQSSHQHPGRWDAGRAGRSRPHAFSSSWRPHAVALDLCPPSPGRLRPHARKRGRQPPPVAPLPDISGRSDRGRACRDCTKSSSRAEYRRYSQERTNNWYWSLYRPSSIIVAEHRLEAQDDLCLLGASAVLGGETRVQRPS